MNSIFNPCFLTLKNTDVKREVRNMSRREPKKRKRKEEEEEEEW